MSDIQYNEELYTRFFAIVGNPEDGKKISQRKAAKSLGYSSGVISSYKSHTYNGAVKALEEKIELWLKREENRYNKLGIPFMEITPSGQIRKICAMVHEDRTLGVLPGQAGSGKSTALKKYRDENPGSVIYIEVDPGFNKNILMMEIARELGLDIKGNLYTLTSRIIQALRGRDMLVIVDEADYLSDNALELLRRIIHDKAETGVIVSGLPRLLSQLHNMRDDHAQFTSRVGVKHNIKPLHRPDAQKVIASVWPDLEKTSIDCLVKLSSGSLRTLTLLMSRSHRIMVENNCEIVDSDIIEAAFEILMNEEAA